MGYRTPRIHIREDGNGKVILQDWLEEGQAHALMLDRQWFCIGGLELGKKGWS